MQALINAIQIALLRDCPSVIAVHTPEQSAIGERAVLRSGRNPDEITFMLLPAHLHVAVPAGTFLDADAADIEAEVQANAKGVQVVFVRTAQR